MRFGTRLGSAGHDRGLWPVLLLVLVAVLVPTAGVLWFMSQAVNQQRDVARQRLSDAYRSQLAFVRDSLDSYWEQRAVALEKLEKQAGQEQPSMVFQQYVIAGVADSVIYLGSDGSVAYPAPSTWQAFGVGIGFPLLGNAPDLADNRPEWADARVLESKPETMSAAAAAYARIANTEEDEADAARAVQAQVRCLVQSGDKQAAVGVIQQQFGRSRFARATDRQGRVIAADEQLLTLNLLRREDRRYLPAARRLHAMLANYDHSSLPSAQRLFLMEEMRALNLGPDLSQFPTYEAERLAARFLEADRGRAGDAALRLSGATDIWKLTSTDGRVIALYRSETVLAGMRRFLNEQSYSKDQLFSVVPPGAESARHDEWTPAGARLPGWQITLTLKSGEQFDATARRQMASYVWIGFLLIATMAVLALMSGQALRRQMRLASLKTDLVAAVSHELKTPLSSMRLLVDSLLDDTEFEPRKTREYLELIAHENLRLSRLIDNFLTFSRMERDRQKFEFGQAVPGEIIQAVIEAAGERFRAPKCRLDVEITPGLPALHADGDALITVLLNLLDNAYKFTPDEKRIGLRAYSASGRICFAVTDNGIGLSPREQKKVFRRFYQVDRNLARQTGGVGLGLSIVEFIVKAHNGKIQVNSQPGAGSTFTISLPGAAASQSGPAGKQGAAV